MMVMVREKFYGREELKELILFYKYFSNLSVFIKNLILIVSVHFYLY